MDFNTIYQTISPYVGSGTIAMGIITVIAVALKISSVIKDIKNTFTSTESEALKAFKKAIPESLSVSIESLAKTEFEKFRQDFINTINEKFINPIKSNTELTQAIAKALMSMRALPDSAKLEISNLLIGETPKTTESLKIELLPVETEKEQEKQTIYVD